MSMKNVYGRYSYRAKRKIDISSLLENNSKKTKANTFRDIEFSDDDEEDTHYDENEELMVSGSGSEKILQSATYDREPKATLDTQSESDELNTDTPDVVTNSIDPLNGLLDFLSAPVPIKKKNKQLRKTPEYSAPEQDLEDLVDFDIRKTLNSVNEFMQSLQQPSGNSDDNDDEAEEPAHKNEAQQESSTTRKSFYGSLRSVLRTHSEHTDKDDDRDDRDQGPRGESSGEESDQDDECNDTETQAIDDGEDEIESIPLTQNFNQLKNMGSNIQYSDDVQYIMEGQQSNVKKLITLIKEISMSEGLRKYLINYYSGEFDGFFKSNEDTFLVCVLSSLIALHHKLELSHFQELFQLESRSDMRKSLDKYYQRQYDTILEQHGSPLKLGVKLLTVIPSSAKREEYVRSLQGLGYLLNADISNSLVELLPCFESTIEKNAPFINRCISSFAKYTAKPNLIKFLISVTNSFNNELSGITSLLNESLGYIVENFTNVQTQELLILHLGLCSNLLYCFPTKIEHITVDLTKIYRSLDLLQDLNFMENLFLLNYAYCLHITTGSRNNRVKKSLNASLSAWISDKSLASSAFYERAEKIISQ